MIKLYSVHFLAWGEIRNVKEIGIKLYVTVNKFSHISFSNISYFFHTVHDTWFGRFLFCFGKSTGNGGDSQL